MRSTEQIEKIKSDLIDPYQILNFINQDEIEHLIDLFDVDRELDFPYRGKIFKNTGPVTLDLLRFESDPVVEKIKNCLFLEIGKFTISSAFFFKTDYPHIIHNDDTFELPDNVFRGITIPLYMDSEEAMISYPKLCFFDQFYFHGPSKFFNKDTDIPTYYNKQIYNYSDVYNLNNDIFPNEIYQKYFTHCKKQWFEGLTFHSAIDWIPGSAIIFDSTRLHCASDFRKNNIKSKLGISIFTKKL
jgi:hypothetical protein